MAKKVLYFVFAFVVLFSLSALGAIIHIPGNYSTIQEGINAANSGDTVLANPGTYSPINFLGKAITVMSASGPDVTVINAGGYSSAVTFDNGETEESKLIGFGITGCNTETNGAIYCANSGPSIFGNKIYSNNAAGIYVYGGSDILIKDNDIFDNVSSNVYGSGISLYYCSASSIDGNNIHHNILSLEIAGGAGIGAIGGYGLNISGNTITENFSHSHAGGIFHYECHFSSICNNLVSGNSGSFQCGGIHISESSNCDLTNNTVNANSCTEYGGGITVGYSDFITVRNNIITNNSGSAGIYVLESRSVELLYSDIWNNYSHNYTNIVPGEGCIEEGGPLIRKSSSISFLSFGEFTLYRCR